MSHQTRQYLAFLTFALTFIAFAFEFSGADVVIGGGGGQDELDEVAQSTQLYSIEGKIFPPMLSGDGYLDVGNNKWQAETTLNINNGEYKGYPREDGTFVISGIPSGSYVLEVHNADYFYEPVRVEINPRGKFRARKVNFVQPAQVIQVPYPLKMKALTRFKYFQVREQWKIMQFILSPMVLMMVLPLLILLVLPHIINDPDTKKEMENIQFPKMNNDMPEISEMITSLFTGESKQPEKEKKAVTAKQNKKRN